MFVILSECSAALTDCDRLDSNAFLEMGAVCIVGIFGLENLLPAKGIDEGSSALRNVSSIDSHNNKRTHQFLKHRKP